MTTRRRLEHSGVLGYFKQIIRRHFLNFRRKYGISALDGILEAPATAELEPLQAGQLAQLDEVDMGMTYKELSVFGRLRKQSYAGPFTMFCRLVHIWDHCTPKEVSENARDFETDRLYLIFSK